MRHILAIARMTPKSLRPLSVARPFFVLLALLAASCGEPPAKLSRLSADAVVLAFGDSLTFGTGAAEEESYPAQLEKLIGRRVVRAGIPGEVTSQALERLPAALDEHAPRLLLLCVGGNDFLRRLGNQQAEANVRAMVRLARGRGVDVMLIGTPQPGFSVTPSTRGSAACTGTQTPRVTASASATTSRNATKTGGRLPSERSR